MMDNAYIAIDLKSFYASVECVERGLDPHRVNLVVADDSRTEKTICLAVSPSLKSYGVPGRPRLFEVIEEVRRINAQRQRSSPLGYLVGRSSFPEELERDPTLALDYIIAPPRMSLYMRYSARIYGIYLRHVAPEDIHVYSVDEVFIDATPYVKLYKISAREFARRLVREVFYETGITATAGIGTNPYLAKVAMDIVAKRSDADETGARIAELDERTYRERLWAHTPITDFWQVGRGYEEALARCGIYTMGDVARCSIGGEHSYHNEELLYRLFGVRAELLIDHAWGRESCTMADIKAYRPSAKSVSTGQVLSCPYSYKDTRLIVREMAELLSLDLVSKGLVTDKFTLTLGYDYTNITRAYKGEIAYDYIGRAIPRHAHGTVSLNKKSSSTREICEAFITLLERIADPTLTVRRVNLTAVDTISREAARHIPEQISIFDRETVEREKRREEGEKRERRVQGAILDIKKRFGNNAIIKGMNLVEGGTTVARNEQIGGHRA